MAAFLAVALDRGAFGPALESEQVGLGTFLRGRRSDPAFDSDCREVDAIEDLAILAGLKAEAVRGCRQSAKLLAQGLDSIESRIRAEAGQLPRWLDDLCRSVRAGKADPFELAAAGASIELARQLQRQGKPPASWSPGEPWKSTRFTADDVARLADRARFRCAECGALVFRLARLDEPPPPADDARWGCDPGFRCPRCGARAGLPFDPAESPPPTPAALLAMADNMRKARR